MSTQTVTKNTKWYVHVVIMFAIFIMFLFIPPISTITEMGMKVLGVTLALLYGWITIDLMWTSLLGFVLLQFIPGLYEASAGFICRYRQFDLNDDFYTFGLCDCFATNWRK